MGIDAAALLAGPRGRRVCLEVARPVPGPLGEPPTALGTALFHAAHGPDREAYRAEAVLLLDAAGLEHPDASRLFGALVTAVDSARYWQGPDDDDVLAATPELRPGLARVAELIASSPHTGWWDAAVGPGSSGGSRAEQWQVAFEGVPAAAPVAAAETLAVWRESMPPAEERWRGFAEQGVPMSGDWWSTPPRALAHSAQAIAGAGPVGLRLVEDGLGWTAATVRRLAVRDDVRVFEVDGPAAWAELCARYPLEVTASRRFDWARAIGREGRWVVPDWSRVAEDHDGVHVTISGYLATAGRAVPVGRGDGEGDGDASVLAGWSPDETVWLRDGAVAPSEDPERWTAADGLDWRRGSDVPSTS